MSLALPKEIVPPSLPELPANTNMNSLVVTPSNSSSFGVNDQIILDLPVNRGYMNPNSMYIRYKIAVTNGVTATSMRGFPVYTPLQQYQMYFGNTLYDQISDYNLVCYDLVQLKMSQSAKVGYAYALGYGDSANTPSFDVQAGKTIGAGATTTFSVSAPIPTLLSNAETYIPLFLCPAIRIIFNVDTLANMFVDPSTLSNFTITGFELCFDVVTFDSMVDQSVVQFANPAGNLVIKSSSFATSAQALPSAVSGAYSMNYNFRLGSIKSVFLHSTPVSANITSGKYESVDPTNGGSIQFDIGGGLLFPPKPLDESSKAGILSELGLALYGNRNLLSAEMGTTLLNFAYTQISAVAAATNIFKPALHIVGCNVERLASSALLTGVSSQLAPIGVKLVVATTTTTAQTVRLLCQYDALLEINVASRNIVVVQ